MKYSIPKFSAKKILFLIFMHITMLIFFRFSTLLEFPDSSIVLEKGDPAVKLKATETLSQKFIASRDNLVKVEFLLRTPRPKPEDVVKMEIADESCTKIIRSGRLNSSFLASDNLHEFAFSKIPNSNGKTFCILATFEPQKSSAKALQFFTQENKQPAFSAQNSSSEDDLSGQALSMRPVYVNDHWWQNLSELSQRMSQYKPWFLKHFFLDAIIILFVILSFGLITILIAL
ncbi:MAG: hypothetical protein HGA36_04525 [Candidatus Moranbacteria bacterium]|nr:hypothetical protein [Candidatus Moranbacteria bacterium]